MVTRLLFSLFIIFSVIQANAQVLVRDSFVDRSQFSDNTLLTLWGSNGTPTTLLPEPM
jgi:hypothetical protein